MEKVKYVQKQVRQWRDQGSEKPMCTARPGWQTISPQNMDYKKRMHQIHINLVDILNIDAHKRYAYHAWQENYLSPVSTSVILRGYS